MRIISSAKIISSIQLAPTLLASSSALNKHSYPYLSPKASNFGNLFSRINFRSGALWMTVRRSWASSQLWIKTSCQPKSIPFSSMVQSLANPQHINISESAHCTSCNPIYSSWITKELVCTWQRKQAAKQGKKKSERKQLTHVHHPQAPGWYSHGWPLRNASIKKHMLTSLMYV